MVINRAARRLVVSVVLLILQGPFVLAQTADTSAASVSGPSGAEDKWDALRVEQLPARTPFLSPTELLQRIPGSFTYHLGERGWPHGWSRYGMAPRHAELTMDELPFSNPVTGHPMYHLLPFELLEPVQSGSVRYGKPHSINTSIRGFPAPRPVTELRYHAGSSKLQAISAAHAQQWPLGLTSDPDSLHVLFGYSGQSTNGIYPRSEMRLRRVLGRLRYWKQGWSLQIRHLYNEHNQHIHGGVLPRGSIASLFEPVGAQVAPQDARRELARHDLTGQLRLRWHSVQSPLTLRGVWADHHQQHHTSLEMLGARVRRLGVQIRQPISLSSHRLRVAVDTWQDRLAAGNALVGERPLTETEHHVVLSDSVDWSALSLHATGGWHVQGDASYGSGTLGVHRPIGFLTGTLEGSMSGYVPSWIERYGFGSAVAPPMTLAKSRHMRGRAAVDGTVAETHVALEGTLQRWENPLVMIVQAEGPMSVEQPAAHIQWYTFSGTVGWRLDARRGFRFSVTPAVLRAVPATGSNPHERLAGSLPEFSIDASLGARYQMFQGDLDALVYLRSRTWSSMRARMFEPSTELFPLPPLDARAWGPAGTLDLQVEAGIRSSTVFFAYKNMLAGLLDHGTLVVPTFPLPARFLQFGIFWPLFN